MGVVLRPRDQRPLLHPTRPDDRLGRVLHHK
nr:MAG TPA: hypothetical protein [Caudoviricetes sp.]